MDVLTWRVVRAWLRRRDAQWEVVWDEAKQQYVKQPPEQSEHNWVWSPQWVSLPPPSPAFRLVRRLQRTAPAPSALAAQGAAPHTCRTQAIAMHQPEYWGYLQFSDAPVDARQRLPAQDEFAPDPTWALRSFLMEAYYRQKARGIPWVLVPVGVAGDGG